MSETREAREAEVEEDLGPAGLLALARDRKRAEDRAAADLLEIAARWADLHPPESVHAAAAFTVRGCEHEEPIAGDGCPLVAEFCVAELGTVLGISSASAKKLIGHALELRHRLPRLWAQVRGGRVSAWRARLVAEATIHATPALTPQAAGWVDAQVAAVAGKVGPAQLDRLIAEAIARFHLSLPDPAADPEDGWRHVDPRHATLDKDDVHFAGTLHFEADLDIADALDLDRALTHGAATQKSLGSDLSLNARRAAALGDLARTQTALDLFTQGHAGATRATDHDGLPVAREVVLHAHFGASTHGDVTVFGPTGRLEEGQRLVLLDQLKGWCGDTRTRITVRPVIDLNTELSSPGYESSGPDPGARHPPRHHLRVPLVHPPCTRLRCRPRDRLRPSRGVRKPTPARADRHPESRDTVQVPPPTQDTHRLALRHGRARGLHLDQPPRTRLSTR